MTTMVTSTRLLIFVLSLLGTLLTAPVSRAEPTEIPAVLPEALRLDEGWKAQSGDDPAWASPSFDDDAWETIQMQRDAFPPHPDWGPVVWYRLRLLRADLANPRGLALWTFQGGASEIYLDGELVVRHGTVAADPVREETLWPTHPALLPLQGPGEHLLAVRYSNASSSAYPGRPESTGIALFVTDFAQTYEHTRDALSHTGWGIQWVTMGLVFTLLHLCFFAFDRKDRKHLGMALIAAGYTGFMGFSGALEFVDNPNRWLLSYKLHLTCGIIMVAAIAEVIDRKSLTERSWLLPLTRAVMAICTLWTWWNASPHGFRVVSLVVILATVPTLFERRPQRSDWLMAVGFAALAVTGLMAILGDMGWLPPTNLFPYGMAYMLLSVLIHQARNLAVTQLAAIDNVRKTAELEEARSFQLGLLPEIKPKISGLEVHWAMQTATEVGGDYYDYVEGEGVLTLAVGDATGHGLRAGMLTMATKGLLRAACAATHEVDAVLAQVALGIEGMELGRQHMALALARLEGRRLRCAVAGTPPLWIWRRSTGNIEEVTASGPPLGAFRGHRHLSTETLLEDGDIVLMMTDGLPEALDGSDNMLGYEAVADHFRELAVGSLDTASLDAAPLEDLVGGLFELAEQWAGGRPWEDDISVVALRFLA